MLKSTLISAFLLACSSVFSQCEIQEIPDELYPNYLGISRSHSHSHSHKPHRKKKQPFPFLQIS